MTESNKAAMIAPTVGRIVWYRPVAGEVLPGPGEQPLAAIVTHVLGPERINLTVFDVNGFAHGRKAVLLIQGDTVAPPGAGYAEWMPYQKGQAAKTEALQEKVDTNKRG